ncbi:MAG: hypothetical protein HY057_10510, partial [Rhodospirillales bacterium]|nr:hypothetical protein [Rhodospirillales bacterium]
HSTYLELALEGGLPALAALLGVGGWLVYRALIGVIRRRRDAIYPCAGLAATALVGTHTAFDFSLQIPAVAATYVMLTAVAVAQSWVHDRRNSVDPKKDQADQSVRL